MHFKVKSASIAAFVALFSLTSICWAGGPRSADQIVQVAREFLEDNADLTGADSARFDYELDKLIAYRGSHFVRFSQTINGLPVFDTSATVWVDESGRVVRMRADPLAVYAPQRDPRLTESQAMTAAVADMTDPNPSEVITLGYFPMNDASILAYEVAAQTPGPHLWVSYVSAETGSLLGRFDAIKSTYEATLYTENPVATPTLTQVTLDNFPVAGAHMYHTYGDYIRTASCTNYDDGSGECTAWEFNAVATDLDGFLAVTPTGDAAAFSEIMVYYAIDGANRFFRDEFGFDGQWGDFEVYNSTAVVELADFIWVYANAPYNNGHYSGGSDWGYGDSIVLGTITGNLAHDNDVTRHEFGHAISDRAFNTGWQIRDEFGVDTTVGGVEEGLADYWAVTIADNSAVGEYAGIARDADNSNYCPEHLGGEGHRDALIVSGTMWEIRTEIGQKKADHIIYIALSGGPTIRSFTDFGQELIAAAESLQSSAVPELVFTAAEVAIVESVVVERNLIDCERIQTLEEDGPDRMHYTGYNFNPVGTPSAMQWVTTTGDTTEVLDLHISVYSDEALQVLVREGEPIIFEWTGSGQDTNWTATYDMEFENDGINPLTLARVSDITDLQLKKNTEYYYSLVCKAQDFGGCYNMISVTTSDEPQGGDADTDTDSDTDTDTDTSADAGTGIKAKSGCGCRAVGTGDSATSLFGLLMTIM